MQVSPDLACCYGSKQVFVWNRFGWLVLTFTSSLFIAMIPAACIEWCDFVSACHTCVCYSHRDFMKSYINPESQKVSEMVHEKSCWSDREKIMHLYLPNNGALTQPKSFWHDIRCWLWLYSFLSISLKLLETSRYLDTRENTRK